MTPEEEDREINLNLRVARKLVDVLKAEFPTPEGTFDVIAGVRALGLTLGLVIGDAPSTQAQTQAAAIHRSGVEFGLELNKAIASHGETEH